MVDDNDDHRANVFDSSPLGLWVQAPHVYPHSHHGTPAHEYSGFVFNSPPMPMDSSGFGDNVPHQREMAQQLQPFTMPQWPSMLGSSSHSAHQHVQLPSQQQHHAHQAVQQIHQPIQHLAVFCHAPPQPTQLAPAVRNIQSAPPVEPVQRSLSMSMAPTQMPTPISASSSRSTQVPRKTLTDADRRRMCQYAEDHPNAKQTEIGSLFGVERSTVSKVLRQKEKYMIQEDVSRSPNRRPKGRSPDIERALAVWAKNQEKKGAPLSDDHIRNQARAFAATTPLPPNHEVFSPVWLEKFKLKNNLMGARSRTGSLATEDVEQLSAMAASIQSAATSSSQTSNGVSPVSPKGLAPSPPELHNVQSYDNLKIESPDSYIDFVGRHPFHSQSTNSLNSAFTDTAPSSFSPGPKSPTSPFFTPDSGVAPSPFMPPPTAAVRPAPMVMAGANSHRPRSQTFPLLDQFISTSGSSDVTTPKYAPVSVLDSPMEESSDPLNGVTANLICDDSGSHFLQRSETVHPADTMRPPPLPAYLLPSNPSDDPMAHVATQSIPTATASPSNHPLTSPEEARCALEMVMTFFDQQKAGFLDSQESMVMGKLLEKLKLRAFEGSG